MAKSKKRSSRADDDDVDAPLKPKSDAYVGLLAIAFVALIAGCVLMYLDHDELAAQTVPTPTVTSADTGLAVPSATIAAPPPAPAP